MTDRSRVSSVLEDESPPSTATARLPLRQSARVSRRIHAKTRTGCKTCKRRKIKCDEKRPSCQNCIKHNVPCDFIRSSQETSPSVAPSLSGEPPLDMLNFELLHNFTISTYSTLSNDEGMRGLWKTDIVRLGTKCDYVMRAILAVSALHMAQNRPEKRDYYVAHGVLHHQIASRAAIRLMVEPEAANFEALWIFSVLTIYFALGSPRNDGSTSLLIGESAFPDWIFLLNGVKHLFECLKMAPYSGILSPVSDLGARRWQASHEPRHADSTLLKALEERITSTSSNETLLEIYQHAINELRCQLSFVLSEDYRVLDIIDAFVWQFAMAERFFPLLKIPTQESIAIFAHHCIVLNRLEGNKWLQGWAACLISRAWDLLDAEHRTWIQWPVEEIGWVPP